MTSRLKRALLVIDMSIEQLANVSYRKKETISNIRQLVLSDPSAFDLILDCRLWIKDPTMSSLPTVYAGGVADTPGAELHPDLVGLGMRFVDKFNYSAFVDSQLDHILQRNDIQQVYVAGINTDFCVFATLLDAFSKRYEGFLIQDACTSICGKEGHEEGIRRATAHFSECCIVSSKSLCP